MIEKKYVAHYQNKEVFEFRLTNIYGNYIELCNYGAVVKSIYVPDSNGDLDNVVLGYPSFQGYFLDKSYIGVTVGPFANRISNAHFTIEGVVYELDKNDGPGNNNHSGSAGWHNKVWDYEVINDAVIFMLHSIDGDGGFPGNIKTKTTYRWTNENELIIDYLAETDKTTHINITNHSYFNLTGCKESIHNHKLKINAKNMLESTRYYIPTGNVFRAEGQQFTGQLLNDVMKGSGLNNYYIFDGIENNSDMQCKLWHEASGRVMETYTSYPGVQLYTGDYLGDGEQSLHNKPYKPFDGLCLECQFYPDSPNHSHFPSTLLVSGVEYCHTIKYKFGIL